MLSIDCMAIIYLVYRHNFGKSILRCHIYCTVNNLLEIMKCRFFIHVQVSVQPRKHAIEPFKFNECILLFASNGGVTHLITFCCKHHHGNYPYPYPYISCESIEVIYYQIHSKPTIGLWIFFRDLLSILNRFPHLSATYNCHPTHVIHAHSISFQC